MRQDIKDIIRDLCKWKGDAEPYPSDVVDTAEVFGIKLHGISEGGTRDDDPPSKKRKDNTSIKKQVRQKKERSITKSVTDPDCGLFVNGELERKFACEAHTACNKNGFILETAVTPRQYS